MSATKKLERSVLIYNLYFVNNWKKVTGQLLKNVPHKDIFVHISYGGRKNMLKIPAAIAWLKIKFGIRKVFVSKNNHALGEYTGFEIFRKRIHWNKYDIGTYMHSKGVTKPGNEAVADWRELMRYFIIDKMEICLQAFNNGYVLYGVNLLEGKERKDHAFQFADYVYRGNFVSFNLAMARDSFLNAPLDKSYYGVEGFWGKLCSIDKAYNAFESGVAHYESVFPENLYKGR